MWDVAHEFWRLISRMILLDLLGLDPYHFWGSGWILSQTASHHASDGLGHGSYGTPRIGSVEPTIPGEGTGLRWWWLYVENMDLSLSLCIWEGCVIYIYYTHAYCIQCFFCIIYLFTCMYIHTQYIYMYINYIYVNMYYSSVDYAEWTFQLCMVMMILGAFITHQSCCIYDFFNFRAFWAQIPFPYMDIFQLALTFVDLHVSPSFNVGICLWPHPPVPSCL